MLACHVLVAMMMVPGNIHAGLLARTLAALIQSSSTVRTQCERMATARNLHVDVQLVPTLGTVRGETVITRYKAGTIRARVRIAFGQDYRELLAHEFEHIIEQLDRVDLRAEADQGRAWLLDGHVFETRRASEAGRRVRYESVR